jgi:hypothetical protein
LQNLPQSSASRVRVPILLPLIALNYVLQFILDFFDGLSKHSGEIGAIVF